MKIITWKDGKNVQSYFRKGKPKKQDLNQRIFGWLQLSQNQENYWYGKNEEIVHLKKILFQCGRYMEQKYIYTVFWWQGII